LSAEPVSLHPPSTQALLPGGSVTALSLPGGARPVIARGSGSHLWDTAGHQYLDYLLGSGPLILGHAHPEVTAAVARQASLGSTFYTVSEPVLELASRIVGQVPCAQMVQFCGSGTEATFYALRLARAATGRSAVLKFEGGFHGGHDYALMSLSPSGPPDYPRAEPDSAGIPPVVRGEVLVAPYNDLDVVSAIVSEHSARLAAILVEPYQRVIEPVPGFLQGLRRLADEHGLVLVFDGTVRGLARPGLPREDHRRRVPAGGGGRLGRADPPGRSGPSWPSRLRLHVRHPQRQPHCRRRGERDTGGAEPAGELRKALRHR
jgi:glutamate-1-semialdehyde 2,1-aminomutase